MRIHDSMMEINTRSQNRPRTRDNIESSAASPNASAFSEHLKNLQANPSASCQNPVAHIANVIWVKVPFVSKPTPRVKAGAYQALSEI